MKKCEFCGFELEDDAVFCGHCGKRIEKTSKKANTNKNVCPCCGAKIDSTTLFCSYCGYEFKNEKKSSILIKFSEKCGMLSGKRLIKYIKNFVVPSNKNDILDFAVFAYSNIDSDDYSLYASDFFEIDEDDEDYLDEDEFKETLSKVWLSKLNQMYKQAKIAMPNSNEFLEIEKMYKEKNHLVQQNKIEKEKQSKKNRKKGLILALCGVGVLASICVGIPVGLKINNNIRASNLEKKYALVQELIADKNYSEALKEAKLLRFENAWSSDDTVKWDQIRYETIELIYSESGMEREMSLIPGNNLVGTDYKDASKAFRNSGFLNVSSVKVPDLITGWIHKDGEVIDISINGSTDFTWGSYADSNSLIIIRYHTFN